MNEAADSQPKETKDGLPSVFNLSELINEDTRNIGKFELPKAVEAANRLLSDSRRDPKTGLLKEEAFKQDLAIAAENLAEDDTLIVYVADLDGFKAVNDALGHDEGDKLLGIAAQAFSSTFGRSTDTVAHGSRDSHQGIARLGGDEYAVFTHKKSSTPDDKRAEDGQIEAEVQARRLNEKFAELLRGTQFASSRVKLSVGSAEHQAGTKPQVTFAKADLAMFKAKYEGKMQNITDDDKEQLRFIIPYLVSLGARVESWLIEAGSDLPKSTPTTVHDETMPKAG